MDDTLFMKDNKGDLLKVGKAAERLAEPGADFSVNHAAGQLRGLAARKLVYASGTVGEGKVVHNLFALYDLAVAKIHSILTVDGAISDPFILQAITAQLYGWPDHYSEARDKRYPSPIRAALAGVARGEFWVCRIDVRRSDQTGDKIVRTTLYDMDKGLPKSKDSGEFMPRISFTLPLFQPFVRLLSDPSKAN